MAFGRRSKGADSDFFTGFTDVAEIGIGSLATVYRAREIGTNRLVALKLLNVRDASPRALESFERESLALGAVSSHPNIVTLYRSFRAADGRPVLVLELCRGWIGEHRPDGPQLPAAEVVSLGIKIAGALETAHRARILHRDVKPQNILVTDFGEPALADFGVAMLQSSTQTTAGLFDFTTLHAAPELLEGGDTSAATDVYELASTLYQLLAGHSAFRAYDGESPASVILRILRDPVQPLVAAQIPTPLSDLLVRAMSKYHGDRPASAAAFAAQLSEVETAKGWPRTPFLVRGSGAAAMPPPPRPAEPLTSAPRAPASRPPEARPPEPGRFSETETRRRGPSVPEVPAVAPMSYPIPPRPDDRPQLPAAGSVPTWVQRSPAPFPREIDTSFAGTRPDLAAEHAGLTIRLGNASLVVDATQLTLRSGMRKRSIPWLDVRAFEPRLDAGPGDPEARLGHLVAVTVNGPVELLATRRAVPELRRLHAELDGYRARAVRPR